MTDTKLPEEVQNLKASRGLTTEQATQVAETNKIVKAEAQQYEDGYVNPAQSARMEAEFKMRVTEMDYRARMALRQEIFDAMKNDLAASGQNRTLREQQINTGKNAAELANSPLGKLLTIVNALLNPGSSAMSLIGSGLSAYRSGQPQTETTTTHQTVDAECIAAPWRAAPHAAPTS